MIKSRANVRAVAAAMLSALGMQATIAQAAEPSTLEVAEVNGAPGWLLDGKPYVPIQAQAAGPQAAHFVTAGFGWSRERERERIRRVGWATSLRFLAR